MWINCYLPNDPRTMQFDDGELSAVLDDIENVLDNNQFEDCILGGDFNYDPRSLTGFTSIINDFMLRVGLQSVWTKFPIEYTHIHTDDKSTAILDHFFVNDNLLNKVQDAGVIHLGDNHSRHSPIMIKIKLPSISLKPDRPNIQQFRRPAWYKANDDDKKLYEKIVIEKLQSLDIPRCVKCSNFQCEISSHSKDRDKHVIDVLSCIIEASYQSIPLTSNKVPNVVSDKERLPQWNEVIAPLKCDSIFWHSIWISAGRPNLGILYQIMCQTRSKYHKAVKIAKKEVARIKADKLLAAVETGHVEFIQEMKNSLHGKSCGQFVPDSLEGKVTLHSILGKFKDCYQELYNSADSCQEMARIKAKVQHLIQNSCSAAEIIKLLQKLLNLQVKT